MNPIPSTLLSAAALLAAAATPAAAEDSQKFLVPLSRPGQPATLEVDLMSGHIVVIGEDRDDLEVTVSATGSKRRIVTPSGARPIPVTSYAVEIEEADNAVEIDSDFRSGPMQLTIRVPVRTSLNLDTVHDASIEVDNVVGTHELEAVHGPVTATGIRGHIVAETVHGALTVELLEASGGEPMAFSTVHGDLNIAFPPDFGADITVESRSDEIFSDFEDIEILPAEPKIERDSQGRHTGISLEQALRLRINGGGTPVRMETLHGKVSIKRADG